MKMRSYITFIALYFYALLSSGTTSSGDEEKHWILSVIEFVELDYEDYCDRRAAATWSELIGNPKGFSSKLERDKAYGVFSTAQANDIKDVLNEHSLKNQENIVKRKVNLLLFPGDTLLSTGEWIELVTFGDTASHKLRFASDYDCGTNTNCTLRELHNSLARQEDESILKRMKKSWEDKLPNIENYVQNILPLVKNAAKQNRFDKVEDYWEFLTEYEGAIIKARELWHNINPLYEKLHKYIALKLKGSEAVGKPLPVHLLRSLLGDDWLNVIENLLPKHPDIYQKIHANIQLKDLGGFNAFKVAEKLIKELNFGEFKPLIENISLFNGTCPTVLVDFCKANKVKTMSCKDVGIGNFIEAHEAVMKIKFEQTLALYSNNSYVLREANRYSAVYEAIPGFVGLMALNPHALNRSGLYQIDRFNFNPNHNRLVLQLITALRDLPKLNYYLAVDEWRLKVLMGDITPTNVSGSWSDFRKDFSLLETSYLDILGDPYVLSNKPYIGHFMGLILKYQIYQSFAEELVNDESDLVNHIAQDNGRLYDAMIQGYSIPWSEIVSDLLAKRENGLEYTAFTDYYRLLDEYLDKQLNPSDDNPEDEYIEPIEPSIPENPEISEPNVEENEIPSPIENTEKTISKPETHENILDNVIDHGDESHSKFSTETSTVGVLEIKNPVAAEDQTNKDTKQASYSTYWWIGIAVAIIIIVILVGVIARKRHNHRKQLEKQRRHTPRA